MMASIEYDSRATTQLADTTDQVRRSLVWFGSLVLTYFVLKVSWLADDAYITLRTVDNLLSGFGPRWNVTERVQVYTHPLWMMLLIPFKAVFSSSMVALLLPCWLAAFTTFPLLFRAARTPLGVVAAFCVLSLSQSVIDFSSSGLESALSHLLLVCLFRSLPSRGSGVGRFSFVLGLLLLNRFDLLALVVPLAVYELSHARGNNRALKLSLAMLPLGFWLTISTIYYGSPLPNTYFAKVGAGISTDKVLLQAARYFVDITLYEPLTLAIIGGGLILAFRSRRVDASSYWLAAGMLLHLTYIFRVGGDFMNARFLTPDVFAAAWIAMRFTDRTTTTRNTHSWALPQSALLTLVLISTTLLVADFHSFASRKGEALRPTSIADERLFYFPTTGLWPRFWGYLKDEPFEVTHAWANHGRKLRLDQPRDRVFVHVNIGFLGYYAGPEVHIVDGLALTDAFIARLPITGLATAGHGLRIVPDLYIESLNHGSNLLQEPLMHQLYDDVMLATRAQTFFTKERLAAVWRLNTGYYDDINIHPEAERAGDDRWSATTQMRPRYAHLQHAPWAS
jgi:arabinofuranosyltransferase